MHIRMMHIQHPAKQQQDLESFFRLREEDCFCDLTFITGGSSVGIPRRCIKVHSLVVAASSDFLKTWMETTFIADLKVNPLPNINPHSIQSGRVITYVYVAF